MRLILLLLMAIMPAMASGQIVAPDTVEEHKPILCTSEGSADVYLWRVDEPAKKVVVASGRGCHIWAPPGKYTLTLTTITITIDWDNKSKDVQYDEFVHALTVEGDSTPPPNPDPKPNPYSPDPEFQPLASPVKAIRLEPADSEALAAMYAAVAAQVRAGAFQNLGQVRAELVKRGTELSLQGKYSGLAGAVEQFLTEVVGLEREVANSRAGRALDTLAWAIYEGGHQ